MSLRVVALALLALLFALAPVAAQQGPARQPDVVFVPTPSEVVDGMLRLAKVTSNDVVYDLGSGDGRIVIAAAKSFGARGVGIDIDPERTREATANARAAGVGDKVMFVTADVLTADVTPATVVMLYLSPSFNSRLAPKLMKELKPGTRVVSHAVDIPGWKPQQRVVVSDRPLFLWTVAAPPSGRR